MKKTLSWLVVVLMAASILQTGTKTVSVKAATSAKNATFLAVRFVPINYERDGKLLDRTRMFPWQKGAGEEIWGRNGYPMPDSELAVLEKALIITVPTENDQQHNINIPANIAHPFFDEAGRTVKDPRLDQYGNPLRDKDGNIIYDIRTFDTTARPLFWTDFYLTVDPAAGKSQLYDHWYGCYDDRGQLWLDPDGYFNDSRYYEYADPSNLYGEFQKEFTTDSDMGLFFSQFNKNNGCKNNPNAYVDPIGSNNTQGPYILDPEHPMFNGELDEDGNVRIYFWDRYKTKRYFRIGWIDMPDFPLNNENVLVDLQPTSVLGADWDHLQRYPLVDFRYWGVPNSITVTGQPQVADYNTNPLKNYLWYYNSPVFTYPSPTNANTFRVSQGDELHTDNISAAGQKVIDEDPITDGISYYASVSPYNPGEFVYRKGIDSDNPTNNTLYFVQENDIRLTPVVVSKGLEGRNYPAYSLVKRTDWDCRFLATVTDPTSTPLHTGIDQKFTSLYRFFINFAPANVITEGILAGDRTPVKGDEVHVDNVKLPQEYGWSPGWNSYEPKEWIYREGAGTPVFNGFVNAGDFRLTDVNGFVRGDTLKKDPKRGLIGSSILQRTSTPISSTFVPRVFGDLLVLAEVLTGGCNEPEYNLSIETDVWESPIPSVTSSSLRTPNGEFFVAAQHVQKNTALDPDGSKFNIPATTYQNIKLKYREYIGVEIFKDSGIDNHIGFNDTVSQPPLKDVMYAYNLSDDYKQGIRGEEYLGANNDTINDLDVDRILTQFPRDVMYVDTPDAVPPIGYFPQYGCGEAIYKNVNMVPSTAGNQIVNKDDVRLTDVTVNVGSNVISYQADSIVAPGDADVNFLLTPFGKRDRFYDLGRPSIVDERKDKTEKPNGGDYYNLTLDSDEEIYHTRDMYYWGAGYQYYYENNILYCDLDASYTCSPGDIRVVDKTGQYGNGSLVGMNDYDMINGLWFTTTNQKNIYAVVENVNDTPTRNWIGIYADLSNLPMPLPIFPTIAPSKDFLNTGDIRLTPIYTDTGFYPAFSVVKSGDTDYVRYHNTPNNTWSAHHPQLRVWGNYDFKVLIADPENDDEAITPLLVNESLFAPLDSLITPFVDDMMIFYQTRSNDVRLTTVEASDQVYSCGSMLGMKKDFWVHENPVHGMSVGKNGDFRFIDWEVFPTDKIGLNLKIEKPLKVEQTSSVDVRVDPPPRPAYWEDDVYHPAEKVIVFIRDVEGPKGVQIYEDYKEISYENPVATFQFTPYRGSCTPDGVNTGWKKTFVKTAKPMNGTSSGRYELEKFDLRVRIVAISETGGIALPAPKSLSIYDPFYKKHTNKPIPYKPDGLQRLQGHAYGDNPWSPVPFNHLAPSAFAHTYDCYGEQRISVLPEEMNFVASKKCVGTLDQRFPNLSMKLIDADNLNDVNDPYGMAISVPSGNETTVFYNAKGGGVDYLFTGFMIEGMEKSVSRIYNNQNMTVRDDNFDPYELTEKVIVQVNLDGTFLYWHWDDSGSHKGMLDPLDKLWVPAPDDTYGSMRIPGYIQSILKPELLDKDCSEGKNNCDLCGNDFRNRNKVSLYDRFGPFVVSTFGVPTYVRNYGEPPRSSTDQGGDILLTVAPRDAMTKLQIQVFTYNILFDYNSSIQHPPYFIIDENAAATGMFDYDVVLNVKDNPGSGLRRYSAMGVDYCGVKEFKVLPPDPYVNFAELSIVDHALQNSQINYTAGKGALSPLPVPTPQIQATYNPMVLDVGKDFRGYPGGQTHTGRLSGGVVSGGYTRSDENHSGWNAYPAVWWWFWYANVDYNNFTDFNKLGTEFFPLTDYGAYFILKDIDGNHLSLSDETPIDTRIRRLEVIGTFATPKVFNKLTNSVTSPYEYNSTRHVPISYDWSGKISVDHSNRKDYENDLGFDWTLQKGDWIPIYPKDPFNPKNYEDKNNQYSNENSILKDLNQLNYLGLKNVFKFEELIPINQGKINFKVTLWDGTVKIFQDCCAEPPTDGVDVHALDIKTDVNTITADQDNKIVVTLQEQEVMQQEKFCNNAYVYVWQDRGVINRNSKLYDGAGDGWITNPPHSSLYTSLAPQYLKEEDLNSDGKISFRDFETEIIGTYDLATNTWTGGVIDARSFQRNNGEYVFDLSETNGARVNTVGLDFGGAKGTPDHVISEFEALPVMITAYKYADDNNDRSFEPLYGFPGTTPQHSHEVYLSGQKFIEVTPILDLSVSVQPNPLTAGVTPELVDPVSPLTFVLTNEEGNPVDLTHGVADATGKNLVATDDVWNFLFHDVHPNPLPEYYWLRTDLHNDDGTRISNRFLYSPSNSPFQPITVDFTLSKDGKYSFRGFCANDEGSFDVFIYTPDRKHAAKATVNVVLPTAEYAIVNTEDKSGTEFQVPGDPDFLLTAADNRLYRIRVTAKNAQGLMLKGVTKGVSTCGGGIKNTTRFTPYSTRPSSYDFTERDRYLFAEHFLQDLYPYTLYVGFDFNDNQAIDLKNAELYNLGGFIHTASKLGQITLGQVYYNTTLVRYDEQSIKGGWDVAPNPNLVPPTTGWGLGAIYNSAHRGGYLFADIDENKRLDYHDSLGLDVNAQTTFYVFAEDLVYLGGLIGDNVYCNNPAQGDLAGYPPAFKTDPATIYSRFDPAITPDGVFMLDWEAFPNREVQIAPPQLKVLAAKTRVELGKELLNTINYDLVYAIENHLIVEVRPADIRDLPMRRDGRVFMIGNQHQTAIYGKTEASPTDPKVMETTLHFTPTGIGENVAYLGYFNKNMNYLVPPYDFKNTSTYTLRNLLEFDSIMGLQIEVSTDGPLHPNRATGVQAKVTEIGSNAPVEGATVTLKGVGVNATGKTDANGVANFTVTPNDKGIILVTATMEGKHIGTAELRVSPDSTAPWIELDPLPPFTNKPQTEVIGRTNPGNTVTLNGTTVQVTQDGSFKGNVPLKEGLNTIVGEAKDKNGLIARKMITITLDTTPPNIFIDDPGYLVNITELEVTGRVEPNSTLTVNGQTAKVVFDIWKTEDRKIAVKPGKNLITVVAIDQAGNSNTATLEVLVYKRTTINLTIDNIIPIIDGVNASPLEAPPFISGGRTMVPVRFISEAFGAKVDYDAATKGITITLGDTVIAMQIGNTTVMVNGKSFTIDAPPVVKAGRTFVPIRFISEILKATVTYDASTRTVTVIRDYLP